MCFTAYAGFHEVCAPKKGDSVFFSAALELLASLSDSLLSYTDAMWLIDLVQATKLIF